MLPLNYIKSRCLKLRNLTLQKLPRYARYSYKKGLFNFHCATYHGTGRKHKTEDKYREGKVIYTFDQYTQATQKIGQLKLFINELEFMKRHLPPDDSTVVYVGAGPGNHLVILCDLFPTINFELYDDPQYGWADGLADLDNVTIHNQFFDNNEALQYAGMENLYLWSDIRTDADDDEEIHQNMMDQQQWVHTCTPVWSQLKFRLPFPHDSVAKLLDYIYTYQDGYLYYQAYNGPNSTEMRLEVPESMILEEMHVKLRKFDDYLASWNRFFRIRPRTDLNADRALRLFKCKCNDCSRAARIIFLYKGNDREIIYRYIYYLRKIALLDYNIGSDVLKLNKKLAGLQ